MLESYALGGAVAATYYLEPISTQDVDVFVRLPGEPGTTVVDPSSTAQGLRRSASDAASRELGRGLCKNSRFGHDIRHG